MRKRDTSDRLVSVHLSALRLALLYKIVTGHVAINPDQIGLVAADNNSTQLNSTGHVTLTAKRDQKKGKKQQLINIPYL